MFTVVVKKHFGNLSVPLLVPDAFSRIRTVVDIRFAISCDCMRSNEIYEFNPGPDPGPKRQRTTLCTPRIVKYCNGH